MNLFSIAPSNSIVLLFDHISEEEVPQFAAQLDQVGRYYRFVRLSDIFQNNPHRKRMGFAVIAFENVRQSLWVRAMPRLREREIPLTLFLRPDCIGLNRLPPAEELSAYREFYPQTPNAENFASVERILWQNPSEADLRLMTFRNEIGPLPIEKLDATRFFATWGQILEIPPKFVDLGIRLRCSDSLEGRKLLAGDLAFIRQQTPSQVTIAFGPSNLGWEPQSLRNFGIEVMLTDEVGVVDNGTDPMKIPRWFLDELEKQS